MTKNMDQKNPSEDPVNPALALAFWDYVASLTNLYFYRAQVGGDAAPARHYLYLVKSSERMTTAFRREFEKKAGDDEDALELLWFLDNYLKPADPKKAA